MNIILLEKSNSFFYAQLKYPAMLSEKLLKSVVEGLCSHKIQYRTKVSCPKPLHQPSHALQPWQRISKKISPWRDCQCDSPTPVEKGNCNIGTENRLASVPIETEWPFWNSWDTGAYQTSLECFCLITSILGLRGTWNVFCSHCFPFKCLIFLDLVLKYCLQLQ